MIRNRRAKIVATVGPASNTPEMLETLFEAGADTFRLNFSHGTHQDHLAVIRAIRTLEKKKGTPIGILQDLQGPKIRLGRLNRGEKRLRGGDLVPIVCRDTNETGNALPLPHPEVFEAIGAGDRLLIDDGRIRLRVVEAGSERITAKVTHGGSVKDKKGVNLPDTRIDLPGLTEKDHADLLLGLEAGVDWVALSFVQQAEDIEKLRTLVGDRCGLIAKIEKPSALTDIDRIVDTSDGVMIARGDLGVEIPPEDVPGHQKKIIQTCRRACRPVIVATQMLESMVDAPGPTRAEASDVATAIYDGADAVMLSAESATGNYPVEAVTVMDRIAVRTERPAGGCANLDEKTANGASPENTIARMAARVADELSSPAIVAYSLSGSTAWRVAAARPAQPIIVITPDLAVARRMALT